MNLQWYLKAYKNLSSKYILTKLKVLILSAKKKKKIYQYVSLAWKDLLKRLKIISYTAELVHTKLNPVGFSWTSHILCTCPTGKNEMGQEIQWNLISESKTKAM